MTICELITPKRMFACVLAVVIASGCARSRNFTDLLPKVTVGTTNREEVINLFGQPTEILANKSDNSESLVFVQKRSSVRRGATLGAAIIGGLAIIPAIVLAPFTFGASLLLIPAAMGAGGIVGGVGGTVVHSDSEKLVMHFDDNGFVRDYDLIHLDGDVKIVEGGNKENLQEVKSEGNNPKRL